MKNYIFDESLLVEGNTKQFNGVTWQDIADYMNDTYGYSYSESFYRRRYKMLSNQDATDPVDETAPEPRDANFDDDCADSSNSLEPKLLLEIKKEKVKLTDERVQNNAYIRRLAREETIREIARDFALTMNAKKELPLTINYAEGDNSAILQISDWHYGMVCENAWNRFDPDICRFRVAQLRDMVIGKCLMNHVKDLHVVNLSDLISGRIHLPMRLQNRFDVVTQTMEVAEILAEFIYELSLKFNIHYYDCSDNHSRIESDKKDSLDLESLSRIIKWYLITRFENNSNIAIHDNIYGDDIITFTCNGFKVGGVHGHDDKPFNVVERLTMMTHETFDLILIAHNHHFGADEVNEVVLVENGSLMGTDHYATKLRKSAKPSQNLIIVTNRNPVDTVCRIILD